MHTRRITLLSFALALLCLSGGWRAAYAQTDKSPLPAPQGYVNDYANVIDAATEARLEMMLTNLDQQAKIEFAVVTVPTTGAQDIFDYSLAMMRGWGIGSADKPGLLLLVAVNDRKYHTQVSRHLEGDLTDGMVGEIQRTQLVPSFKAGDYSGGIANAVQTYVATLAEKRGFSLAGIDQREAYRPATRRSQPRSGGLSPCMILFIILIVVFFLFRSGRGGGRGGGGCLNLLLLNSLLNSGSNSSGWGGGGFGGGSGGGGGGFGGFSGGGGDAGGGGSGGSW